MIYRKIKADVGKILRELSERKGVEVIEAEACPDHIHMLVSISPHISVATYMGYVKSKSSLMIFDKHANLKYKYGNRHFWCRGYYVDTVGKYENAIKFAQKARALGNGIRFYFGKVSGKLANAISGAVGKDLTGYNIAIRSDEVLHSYRNHGNAKTEALRGHLPVNEQTICSFRACSKTRMKWCYSRKKTTQEEPRLKSEKI